MDEPSTSISEGSLCQVFLDRPRGALLKEEITLQVIDSGWEVRTGFWGDYYVMRLHDRNRWALGFLCTSLFKTGIVKRLDDGAVVRLSEYVVTNYKWGKLCLFIVKMDVMKVQPLVVPSEDILPLSELTGENTQYPIDPPLRLPTIPHLYGARTVCSPASHPSPILNFKKALQHSSDESCSSKCMDAKEEEATLVDEKYSEIWSFREDEFREAFGTSSEKAPSSSSREEGTSSLSDNELTNQPQQEEREQHQQEAIQQQPVASSTQIEPNKKYDFDFFPVPYDLVGQFFHIPEPNLPVGPSVTGFPPPAAFSDCRNQFPRKNLPGDHTLLPPGQLLSGSYYPLVGNPMYYAPPPPPDRERKHGGIASNRNPQAFDGAYAQQNMMWETGQQNGVSVNNPQGVKRGNRSNNPRSRLHGGHGLKQHGKTGGKSDKGQNIHQRYNQQLQDLGSHTVLSNNSHAAQCSGVKDHKKSWYGPFIFPPSPLLNPPYMPCNVPNGGIRPPPHMFTQFNGRPRLYQHHPRLGMTHWHPNQRFAAYHSGFTPGANNFVSGNGYCVLQNGFRVREARSGWGMGIGMGTRHQGRQQQGRWHGGGKTNWGKKY